MVFAKIFPEGSDAEQALHLVYKDQISDYHRQFIRVKLKRGKPADASDSDSGSDRSKDQETDMYHGYYELSLDLLPTQIAQGWRLGRGYSRTKEEDRAVDILLIGHSHRTEGVAAVHALIQFHPRSGAVMIIGVLDEKPVEYEVADSKKRLILRHGEKHVLCRPRNSIKVGKLYYSIVFEAFDNSEEYVRYQTARDLLFNTLGYEKPHRALSAIPRYEDAKKGPVVLHGTMSQGASGWVYAAVNARNGEPLAVKEHRPKNKETARNVMRELMIGRRFAVGWPLSSTSYRKLICKRTTRESYLRSHWRGKSGFVCLFVYISRRLSWNASISVPYAQSEDVSSDDARLQSQSAKPLSSLFC